MQMSLKHAEELKVMQGQYELVTSFQSLLLLMTNDLIERNWSSYLAH